jgi:hypothetical protein
VRAGSMTEGRGPGVTRKASTKFIQRAGLSAGVKRNDGSSLGMLERTNWLRSNLSTLELYL